MSDDERTASEQRARANHPSENPKWWVLKTPPYIVRRTPDPAWPSHDDIIEALLFALNFVAAARRPYRHFALPLSMGHRNAVPAAYSGPKANPFKVGDLVDWTLTQDDYAAQRIASLIVEHGVGPYRVMSATNSKYVGDDIGTVPPQVTVMPVRGVARTTTPFAYSWFRLIDEDES